MLIYNILSLSSLFISVVVGIWKLSHDCNYCRSQTLSEAWCDFNLLSRCTFVLLPIKAVFTELTEPINLLVCLLHWFSCSAFLSKAVCFVLPTESHSCCIGDLANYEEYVLNRPQTHDSIVNWWFFGSQSSC